MNCPEFSSTATDIPFHQYNGTVFPSNRTSKTGRGPRCIPREIHRDVNRSPPEPVSTSSTDLRHIVIHLSELLSIIVRYNFVYTNSFHKLERNIVSLTADCRIHADNRAYRGDEQTNSDEHTRSFILSALDSTVTSEG